MAKSNLWQWSSTNASNTDIGGTDISGSTGLVKNGDNAIREIMAQMAASEAKGSDVASASTIALGTGRFFHITGTTTITDIDFTDAVNGRWAVLEFDGALTLTHNATTLTLPGGASITTAAGDRAFIVQDSGDKMDVLFYQPYASVGPYQPLDSDLTTIAGLTATTDNFIQSKSSAWASRTPTQVTADLIAVVGDSGSGGTKGLVPAPSAGDAAAGKYLKADGTWATVSTGQPVPSSSTLAVGTLLMCAYQSSGSVSDGSTTSGSNLARLSGNIASAAGGGGVLTGTWKNVNGATIAAGNTTNQIGYWVRTA